MAGGQDRTSGGLPCPLSKEDQVKQCRHPIYEIKMLLYTAFTRPKTSVSSLPPFQGDYLGHAAFLESFLGHIRNLIFFFLLKRKFSDDLHILDFFDESEWTEFLKTSWYGNGLVKAPGKGDLAIVLDNMNKKINHISKSRVAHDNTWNGLPLVACLFPAMELFLKEMRARGFKTEDDKAFVYLEAVRPEVKNLSKDWTCPQWGLAINENARVGSAAVSSQMGIGHSTLIMPTISTIPIEKLVTNNVQS